MLRKPWGAAAQAGGADPPPWPGRREGGPRCGLEGVESVVEVEACAGGWKPRGAAPGCARCEGAVADETSPSSVIAVCEQSALRSEAEETARGHQEHPGLCQPQRARPACLARQSQKQERALTSCTAFADVSFAVGLGQRAAEYARERRVRVPAHGLPRERGHADLLDRAAANRSRLVERVVEVRRLVVALRARFPLVAPPGVSAARAGLGSSGRPTELSPCCAGFVRRRRRGAECGLLIVGRAGVGRASTSRKRVTRERPRPGQKSAYAQVTSVGTLSVHFNSCAVCGV